MEQIVLDQLTGGRALPATLKLTAGPLSLELVNGELCDLRFGNRVLVERIYVACRDLGWNTVPGRIRIIEKTISDNAFDIHLKSDHQGAGLDYSWDGRITGTANGRLSFEMTGRANAAFDYAKISICVHHPLASFVGVPYRATGPDGTSSGELPQRIDPQRVVDGELRAMFPPYDHLEFDHAAGKLALSFYGDLWEMQDHRNWGDANFKSYGTPMRDGGVHSATAKTRFHQKVEISFAATSPIASRPEIATFAATGSNENFPRIGIGHAGDGRALTEAEIEVLRPLAADHLRVDLRLADPDWQDTFDRAAATASALDAGLEIAVFAAGPSAPGVLDLFAAIARSDVPVHRMLAFEHAEGYSATTPATSFAFWNGFRKCAAEALPDIPVFGGTDQFFAEINRDPQSGMDAVSFSLNPQVHMADDRSLLRNPSCYLDILSSADALFPGAKIAVSPVTMVGRTGPYPDGPEGRDGLPPNVDQRLQGRFSAVWTLAAIAGLVDASSLTFFDVAGLVDASKSATEPRLLPAGWVVRDVQSLRAAKPVRLSSDRADAVAGLAFDTGDRTVFLLGNLTPDLIALDLTELAGSKGRLALNAAEPDCTIDGAVVTLPAYGYTRIST